MDNPETRATLGTQGAGRRQTKQKHNTEKRWTTLYCDFMLHSWFNFTTVESLCCDFMLHSWFNFTTVESLYCNFMLHSWFNFTTVESLCCDFMLHSWFNFTTGTSNYRQDPSSGLSYPCIYSIVSITTGAAYWNVATFINVKFAMGKLK